MRNDMLKIIYLFTLCLFLSKANAQPVVSSYRAGLFYNLSFENMSEVNLPYFDNNQLLEADTYASCSKRYGIEAVAPFDFWEQSQLENPNL